MALIKCPECGKEVSDSASNCPGCGYPLSKTDATKTGAIPPVSSNQVPVKKKSGCLVGCLTAIIIFALFIFVIVTIGGKSTSTNSGSSISNSGDVAVIDKESAEELDAEIWAQLVEVIKMQNNLMDAMTKYSDGKLTELNFYNYCKDVSKFAASVSYQNSKNENAKKYISSCETYTIYLQMTADSLIKYVDTKTTKDLSKVQENIETTQQAVTIVLQNRGAFLTSAGYTIEEVEQIANDAVEAIGATDAQ